ncbi:MAG: cell division protein FtsZ [Candidatus Huberarchaeum crystalense]|uniref:Cell division protein FtsZ n=1 Tax=Huberarchaeum crystalense TaxID=2014257 RepID=A0A2H9QSF0_HUBC1|nr:cell division protein FtsZ [archaeon]PJB04123.1 MAG: cell division protein FtsZ [Candidatus Huberarchaeum crystalense]
MLFTSKKQGGKMSFLLKKAEEIADIRKGEFTSKFNEAPSVKIIVFGCGGAGSNAATNIFSRNMPGVTVVAANTDAQHLNERTRANQKILLGAEVTKGRGAGGIMGIGGAAAEASIQEIKNALKGSDLVFITAGMGGGTGTGTAPIVAKAAKDLGALVISIITMPFSMECGRIGTAISGLAKLREFSDTVTVIDNNRITDVFGDLPCRNAFAMADTIITTSIEGIATTVNNVGEINLDFSDLRRIFETGGTLATVGVGEKNSSEAKTEEESVEAAVKQALSSPLLDITYEGATGALVDITVGTKVRLRNFTRVGEMIASKMDPGAINMVGLRVSPDMGEHGVRVITTITGVSSPQILNQKSEYEQVLERKNILKSKLGLDAIEID